jgi:RHS repeat-associated protein
MLKHNLRNYVLQSGETELARWTIDPRQSPNDYLVNGSMCKTFIYTAPSGSGALSNISLELQHTDSNHKPTTGPVTLQKLVSDTVYSYDHRNQLIDTIVNDLVNAIVTDVKYTRDVYGRIIDRAVDQTHGGNTDHQEQIYVYDGTDRLMEFDDSGNLTRRYFYSPTGDMFLGVEQLTYNGSSHTTALLWPISDPQGTVRDIFRSDCNILEERFDYGDFGSPISHQLSIYKDLAFNQGRPYDWNIDLYINGARMYNPVPGAFTSEDPITLASGESNFYRSCKNSPQNYTNPSGCRPAAFHLALQKNHRPSLSGRCGNRTSFARDIFWL